MNEDYKTQRAIEIAETATHTASSIAKSLRQLPKTGKRRNIFSKTYNRRPMKKIKTAAVMLNTAFAAFMGAAQISRIIETPIPKFPQGARFNEGGIVGHSGKEVVITGDGKLKIIP